MINKSLLHRPVAAKEGLRLPQISVCTGQSCTHTQKQADTHPISVTQRVARIFLILFFMLFLRLSLLNTHTPLSKKTIE